MLNSFRQQRFTSHSIIHCRKKNIFIEQDGNLLVINFPAAILYQVVKYFYVYNYVYWKVDGVFPSIHIILFLVSGNCSLVLHSHVTTYFYILSSKFYDKTLSFHLLFFLTTYKSTHPSWGTDLSPFSIYFKFLIQEFLIKMY